MGAVQSHVLGDQVSLPDEVMLLERGRPEVALDTAQDSDETIAALRAGGVVDQIEGHEVVQHRVVGHLLSPQELPDHLSRATRILPGARRAALGEVESRHAAGMPGRPFDQLDSVAVRIGEPRRPKVLRSTGRLGRLGVDCSRSQVCHRCVHIIDLDHEVVEATGLDPILGEVVNKLEGHELVAGQLEHRQRAGLGFY